MVALNERGLLSDGVHDLILAEVGELFGRFQRSDRRMTLFRRLSAYVAEMLAVQPALTLYIDGSFVMATVDEPADVDLILILPESWEIAAELRPFEYNVISKSMVRKRYHFDLLVARESTEAERDVMAFFAQVNRKWIEHFGWPDGLKKGIVRLKQ